MSGWAGVAQEWQFYFGAKEVLINSMNPVLWPTPKDPRQPGPVDGWHKYRGIQARRAHRTRQSLLIRPAAHECYEIGYKFNEAERRFRRELKTSNFKQITRKLRK